jgi:hypothetical protein
VNIPLLEKIAEIIIAEPENFDMGHFHCGTSHCIGGWAEILTGTPNYESPSYHVGQAALELTDAQAYALFYSSCWPKRFKPEKLFTTPTPEQAVEYIRYFIEKDGEVRE